jgi:hypothetical protein
MRKILSSRFVAKIRKKIIGGENYGPAGISSLQNAFDNLHDSISSNRSMWGWICDEFGRVPEPVLHPANRAAKEFVRTRLQVREGSI